MFKSTAEAQLSGIVFLVGPVAFLQTSIQLQNDTPLSRKEVFDVKHT